MQAEKQAEDAQGGAGNRGVGANLVRGVPRMYTDGHFRTPNHTWVICMYTVSILHGGCAATACLQGTLLQAASGASSTVRVYNNAMRTRCL